MKIHILYNFKEGAWGGGNQFLKALRKYFIEEECYAESPNEADVILFNSHHELDTALKLKKRYSEKTFVHRVGPIFSHARDDPDLDELIFRFNRHIADGTIFQSEWSRQEAQKLGMRKSYFETVITNAPDPEIFYRTGIRNRRDKINLIATSWSSNFKKKGFDIYKFLDENLDFDRYEMTFVGNSSIKFERIRYIPPKRSERLAELLREHDIFIITSIDDACSNSLIEALHCGLSAVVRNSGGHPEIVDKAGVTFEGEDDVLDAIERIAKNLDIYRKNISPPDISVVGESYYEFCKTLYDATQRGDSTPKKIDLKEGYYLKVKKWQYNCSNMYDMVQGKLYDLLGGHA